MGQLGMQSINQVLARMVLEVIYRDPTTTKVPVGAKALRQKRLGTGVRSGRPLGLGEECELYSHSI